MINVCRKRLKKTNHEKDHGKNGCPSRDAAQAKVAEAEADLRNAAVEGQRIIKRSRHAGWHLGSRPFRPYWAVQPVWTKQQQEISAHRPDTIRRVIDNLCACDRRTSAPSKIMETANNLFKMII